MAKYHFELKKKVVEAYLDGKGGYKHLAKEYGITNESSVRRWINAYQKLGDKGVTRSRKRSIYTFEDKLRVVELYLSSEISYKDLALQESIVNPTMICNWVNRFRIAGLDGLRPQKKGRKKTVHKQDKPTQTKPIKPASIDTSAEHIKALEAENLKLRIENAFLKELRRLRIEDEGKMRERHVSSTVSDENLN